MAMPKHDKILKYLKPDITFPGGILRKANETSSLNLWKRSRMCLSDLGAQKLSQSEKNTRFGTGESEFASLEGQYFMTMMKSMASGPVGSFEFQPIPEVTE